MNLKVLGSSSKGNCYILQTDTGKLILDCGMAYKEIQRGLDFNLQSVLGCLVTHEHGDHSKAVKDLVRAGIDVYMTQGTATALGVNHHRLNVIQAGKQFALGDFTILPFATEHDCAEPVGYLVQYRPTGEKLLFATDTYYLRNRFNGLNYIMIESNYCKDTLTKNIESGAIPPGLKNRLLESHFSLENVKGFLQANDLSKVRKIILIHLSDSNSDSSRMQTEIRELTKKETVIADPGMMIPLVLFPF
jgi:phosphoribosyl 1,2-cyclic phosphodiesterase